MLLALAAVRLAPQAPVLPLSIDATRILLGALLLVFGRRLFWLFVGTVGFVGGLRFADKFLPGRPDDFVIVFSLVMGLVAAVISIALRRIALAIAGFLAGGYLLANLLNATGQTPTGTAGDLAPWMVFAVGGIVGAVLMNVLFDWTLIILSSMAGAALICECIHSLNMQIMTAIFTALSIVGIMMQAGFIRRRPPVV